MIETLRTRVDKSFNDDSLTFLTRALQRKSGDEAAGEVA